MQRQEHDAGRAQRLSPPPPQTAAEDAQVTEASKDSFPASDPPAWIPTWLGQDEDASGHPTAPAARQEPTA